MSRSGRVTISLSYSDLKDADRIRRSTGENRSAFFKRLLRDEIARRKERQKADRYVEGYRKKPETPDEIKQAMATGLTILAEEPWET